MKSKIVINEDMTAPENLTVAKDINAKGIPKSNSSLDLGILKRKWIKKGKALMIVDDAANQKNSHSMHSNHEDNSKLSKSGSKRKVCFTSPNNHNFYYNPSSAPTKKAPRINDSNNKENKGRSKLQKINRVRRHIGPKLDLPPRLMVICHILDLNENFIKEGKLSIDINFDSQLEDNNKQDKIDQLLIDMDFVSETPNYLPQTDSLLSNSFTVTPKVDAINNLGQCSKDSDMEDLQDFKKQLVPWLKENNLKLSPTTLMDQQNSSYLNIQNEALDFGTTFEKEGNGSNCVK